MLKDLIVAWEERIWLEDISPLAWIYIDRPVLQFYINSNLFEKMLQLHPYYPNRGFPIDIQPKTLSVFTEGRTKSPRQSPSDFTAGKEKYKGFFTVREFLTIAIETSISFPLETELDNTIWDTFIDITCMDITDKKQAENMRIIFAFNNDTFDINRGKNYPLIDLEITQQYENDLYGYYEW